MKDIILWQRLLKGSINVEERSLVEALAGESADVRLPFFGFIHELLESTTDVAIHAAALAVLSGATGRVAWHHLVTGLDSDHEMVRQAALLSLRDSSARDGWRWVHALFHENAGIRHEAIVDPPNTFDRRAFPFLLPDLAHRDVVGAIVEVAPQHPRNAALFLGFSDLGVIERERACELILKLDWAGFGGQILDYFAYDTKLLNRLSDELGSIEPKSIIATAFSRKDAFDRVLELVSTREDWSDALAYQLNRGLGSQTLDEVDHLRVALSVIAVGSAESVWRASLLSIAAFVVPALLAESTIPLESRKEAARSLLESPARGASRYPLGELLESDLCRDDLGSPDLSVIAGLLRLTPDKPYSLLLRYVPVETIVSTFIDKPDESIAILSLDAQSRKDRELLNHIINEIIKHSASTGRSLAKVALGVPRLHLSWVAALEPTIVLELTQALLESVRTVRLKISDRKLRSIAEAVTDPLITSAYRLGQALKLIARCPGEKENMLALELLGSIGRRGDEDLLVSAVTALATADLSTILELEQHCERFPYSRERALAEALINSDDESVQAWIRKVALTPVARVEERSWDGGGQGRLSVNRQELIATCPENKLSSAVSVCLAEPSRGLCEALARRPRPVIPNLEVCGALLGSYDSPEVVAFQFLRFGHEDRALLDALDLWMVSSFRATVGLPFLGNVWLHRWENPHFQELYDQIPQIPGGLAEALRLGLRLASSALRLEVWNSVMKVLAWAKWRERPRLDELATLELIGVLADIFCSWKHKELLESAGLPAGPPENLDDLQQVSAQILVSLNRASFNPLLLDGARDQLIPAIADLSSDVKKVLASWFDVHGFASRAEPGRHDDLSSENAHFDAVRTSNDFGSLAEACRDRDDTVASDAAWRLVDLGEEGIETLFEIIIESPEPPAIRRLTATIKSWPDGSQVLALVRDALREWDEPAKIRFLLGKALLERGESWVLESLIGAANEAAESSWFERDDWSSLLELGCDELSLACGLAISPHVSAHVAAVLVLLEHAKRNETSAFDGLRRFLEIDSKRPRELRLKAARCLAGEGDLTGFPVILSWVLRHKRDQLEEGDLEMLDGAPAELVIASTMAVLVAGEGIARQRRLMSMIRAAGTMDAETVQRALVMILNHGTDLACQSEALDRIPRASSRERKLRRLAEACAWGVRRGRELVGQLFQVSLVGGDELGFTRLERPEVFVNPLPLLRGEQNGEAVVKALVLHELGHHKYHGGDEGQAQWRQAQSEGLERVLNLVADEHLERNLRALEQGDGDKLKVLDAYAFQHSDREVHVERLLEALGPRAFDVLTGARLEAARAPSHVAVHQGAVLHEMERRGVSFARFVRALRMGLGDRFHDEKVSRALTLFGRSFRQASMERLLEISRELRAIFGGEIDLLREIGQDGLNTADASELLGSGEGIVDEELQREIERVLNPPKRDTRRRDRESERGALVLNVGPDEEFGRIHTIIPISFDPVAHQPYKKGTARASAHLRRFLMMMGLTLVPQRGRVTGRALDRSRLQAAVVRGDPRILVSRTREYRSDLFLGVLIDCSGSMSVSDRIERAKSFAVMIAEAAKGLKGVDARFFGFTDREIFDAGTAERCSVHGLVAGGGNNDAAALLHAAMAARASRRSARLLVMISDGLPTECSVSALKALVTRLSLRQNICCAQVAVAHLEEISFPHYIELTEVEDSVAVIKFGEIIARLVRTALRGG